MDCFRGWRGVMGLMVEVSMNCMNFRVGGFFSFRRARLVVKAGVRSCSQDVAESCCTGSSELEVQGFQLKQNPPK